MNFAHELVNRWDQAEYLIFIFHLLLINFWWDYWMRLVLQARSSWTRLELILPFLAFQLKSDIINIYTKLRLVQSQLTDSEQSNNAFGEVNDDIISNTDLVTKLVDHVIELIQEKVLTLGVIDARTDSPCRVRFFSLEKRCIFCFVLDF